MRRIRLVENVVEVHAINYSRTCMRVPYKFDSLAFTEVISWQFFICGSKSLKRCDVFAYDYSQCNEAQLRA